MSRHHPKRNQLTLDLNATTRSRRTKASSEVLTSPDVQMLKLSSPQLEAFLSRDPLAATPTPSGYTFPTTVTAQQELYVKEFDDALKKKHAEAAAAASASTAAAVAATNPSIVAIERATSAFKQQQQLLCGGGGVVVSMSAPQGGEIPPLTVIGASSLPSTISEASRPSTADQVQMPESEIKMEPDDQEDAAGNPSPVANARRSRSKKLTAAAAAAASSGHCGGGSGSKISPIDMDVQEKIKLERKRLRNRLAAHKCRKRKLEKISNLDDKVKDLKGENSELAQVLKKLKDSVCDLKQEVMEHMNSGCQINTMAVMGGGES